MKNKGLLASIVIVLVIVVVAVVVASNHKNNTYTMNMPSTSKSTQSSQNNSSAVATTAVNITGFSFSPATIKVKVGQSVTWTNEDSVSHSVTADTASADAPASQLLSKGQTYSFTFNKAGTYTYHCQVHPDMKGTVVVSQ